MAIIWDGRARPHAVLRVLEELATQFEPSLASHLSLALSPSIACLHFSAAFTAYSRAALNQLEAETIKSGGRFVELLRIAEDKREAFKAQFLTPPQSSPLLRNNFKDCAQPLLEHLAKLGSVAVSAPEAARSSPTPHPPSGTRQGPRFSVNLQVEFATEDDFVREHATTISKGGLFLRTSQRPSLNSELKLRLKLPNGELIETMARVVYVRDQPDQGVGLAFSREDSSFRAALNQYLALLQRG
ncbi:MAG TPA: TIGR02266 family protein [Myxococcaceae bacterium]|nr:TIGR02266 family protein [Myxococcaceae bacterium]